MNRRPGARNNRGRVGGQRSGGWTPARLGDLELWLRADMGITLNGSTVSAWDDQSGSGNHFTQSTPSLQPNYTSGDSDLSGRAAVVFTVNSNRLSCANSITIAWVGVVAVYPAATFSDFSTLLAKGANAGDFAFRGESGTASWRTADGITGTRSRDGTVTGVALTSANVPHNYELVPSSPSTASTWVIGHNPGTDRRWNDSVAEMVICSAEPSAADKASWRSYCRARYGTP